MTALRQPTQTHQSLADHMQGLFSAGHNILPLGAGDDGKSPLVAFRGRSRLPLSVVQKRMAKAQSRIYGLRLDKLTVVDCDTDNAATSTYVESRFGVSSVQVKTPRGRHHYFRAGDTVPKAVRLDGVALDFKAGPNAYVAGPGSIRPDGGAYMPDVGVLAEIASLPVFRDCQHDSLPAYVPTGERTFHLWKKAREFVETADSEADLFAELQGVRDWEFASPETYSDARISKAAKWAWERRLENQIWGGSVSAVKTYQNEFEALMQHRNGSDALALLHCLRHNHSGSKRSNEPFCIATEAMARNQVITGWSASRFYRAKVTLETVGLIRLVIKGYSVRNADGSVAGIASTYRFSPLPDTAGGRVLDYIHFTGEMRSTSKIAGAN